MQIISGTTEFECKHHTAVAIGKFDGIHQGHRMLLSQILKAKEDGLQSAVFTFDPPSRGVFLREAAGGADNQGRKKTGF